jgi:hypothetical protein
MDAFLYDEEQRASGASHDATSDLFLLQMLVPSLGNGIEESVALDRATAVICIRQDREALEAELGHAASTHHFVALLPLRPLRI